MTAAYLPIAAVKPWWLRFGLLLAFASPMLSPQLLHGTIHADHPFADLANWTEYCVFIWLFTWMCVGLERLLGWLALAAVFGLTLALGGAAIGKTGVWELVQRLAITMGSLPSVQTSAQHELDLIFRLLMIMASLPFALLILNSFQASDIFERAVQVVRKGSQRRAKIYVRAAIVLRMVQHVFEVFAQLLLAWREENPQMLLPRSRDDLRGTGYVKLAGWAKAAVWSWSQALLMRSLLFVPVAVRDWREVIGDD